MNSLHHGHSPSAEFPWLLLCPGKPAQYFQSCAMAEHAARACVEEGLTLRESIVIAYALGTLAGNSQEVRMVSHRSQAVVDMLAKREEQRLAGRDPARDPALENGSTAHAAGAYLTAATAWSVPRELRQIVMASAEEWWPWPLDEWKPEGSALGNLCQALALLLAETERLERHRHTWQRLAADIKA